MKTILVVVLSVFFLNGCVYTRPAPYSSRYTVVTPAPRYERHFYTPRPPPRIDYYRERPRFDYYRESPRFHSRPRSRRYR
jgi:hypothetical protein